MELNYKVCNGIDDSQAAIDAGEFDMGKLLLSNGKNGPSLDALVKEMYGDGPHYHQMYEEACIAW